MIYIVYNIWSKFSGFLIKGLAVIHITKFRIKLIRYRLFVDEPGDVGRWVGGWRYAFGCQNVAQIIRLVQALYADIALWQRCNKTMQFSNNHNNKISSSDSKQLTDVSIGMYNSKTKKNSYNKMKKV